MVRGEREDGWGWMSTFSSDAHLVLCIVFEEALDTTTGELNWTNC